MKPKLPGEGAGELPMMRVRQSEYEQLAVAMGKSALARRLEMENGILAGWRSNRYAYASPIAYRVATGMDVRGYVHERDKQRFMVRGD